MRFIKELQDIKLLKEAGVLEKDYLKQVEKYFYQLHTALGGGKPVEEFRLDWPEGFIVILEAGDNLRDLRPAGLNREDNGLLGSSPEFVELIELQSAKIYKVSVLLDNECMQTFFTKTGIHDQEIESWLAEEAMIDKYYDQKTEDVPF